MHVVTPQAKREGTGRVIAIWALPIAVAVVVVARLATTFLLPSMPGDQASPPATKAHYDRVGAETAEAAHAADQAPKSGSKRIYDRIDPESDKIAPASDAAPMSAGKSDRIAVEEEEMASVKRPRHPAR